jgi:D-glycero-D-manno-heptose 1,7-bisphosphate phosphatase
LNKAILFDRDGTLLVECGYVAHPTQVALYAQSLDAVRLARQAGFMTAVVSNQSGVARGWLTEGHLAAIHERMKALLAQGGAGLDGVYYCPHHPQGTVPEYRRVCSCRKPGTGLGRLAAETLGLDLARSFVIGDKISDVAFGKALGARPCLVRTGFGGVEEARLEGAGLGGVPVADNVADAVRWALREDLRA